MRLFRRHDSFVRPQPPATVTLAAIGYVRNEVTRPRPHGWQKVESRIEILPEHTAKTAGLEDYSDLIVVFYLDVAETAPDFPDQLTLDGGHVYGIFATRSQLRPNHLGVSAVPLFRVERIEGRVALIVRGLDAIDGTPVLDIKPYLPEYDAIPGARIPRA